jgi:hypothetical protein
MIRFEGGTDFFRMVMALRHCGEYTTSEALRIARGVCLTLGITTVGDGATYDLSKWSEDDIYALVKPQ